MLIGDGGRHLATSLLLLLLLCCPSEGCGPGRGSGRRRRPKKLTPLVFKQHVPNVSENTLGASGLPDGPIKRGDAKFKDLVRNNNPDILFKDEEGTGADRIMSQRCKDKLNTLAVSVLNQWPGVKLRVTEAWDEDGMHAENSLHYEGRAVDITTSDRDRSKYGMLARLAVEAGFDWVYYETRGHIHCSVQSDSSIAINFGGCFPPSGKVITPSGRTLLMSELQIGDRVLSMNQQGRLAFSEVIAFLDLSHERVANFYTITTQSGRRITLTAKHLIHAADSPYLHVDIYSKFRTLQLLFAEDVQIGQYIFVAKDLRSNSPEKLSRTPISHCSPATDSSISTDCSLNFTLSPERVISVQTRPQKGTYAPLTMTGTIVVDNFVASCYAFMEDEKLAHRVFAPVRAYYWTTTLLRDWLGHLIRYFEWMKIRPCFYDTPRNETIFHDRQDGTHWYARLLYKAAVNIFEMDLHISL